jgi:hypothetical protein
MPSALLPTSRKEREKWGTPTVFSVNTKKTVHCSRAPGKWATRPPLLASDDIADKRFHSSSFSLTLSLVSFSSLLTSLSGQPSVCVKRDGETDRGPPTPSDPSGSRTQHLTPNA